MTALLGLLGLVALVWGAEQLVRGATAVSDSLGVPPLVIGLTVLAFGTSAPEAAVGIDAASRGAAGLAIGNVVGSNIFNVLLILGLSAALRPLAVTQEAVYRQVPLMIVAGVVAFALMLDGELGRPDSAILLAGIVLFTVDQWRQERRRPSRAGPPIIPAAGVQPYVSESTLMGVARAGFGLGLLVVGSRGVVSGALAAAEALGVPPVIAGLTIVAIGTSLPELLTSTVASLRGRADLAIGNVLGSNVFNVLFVLGAVGTAAPGPVTVPRYVLLFDGPVMIAAALACLPVFYTGRRIARWEGVVFLGHAAAYLAVVYLRATGGVAPTVVWWAGLTISGSLAVLTVITCAMQRRAESVS